MLIVIAVEAGEQRGYWCISGFGWFLSGKEVEVLLVALNGQEWVVKQRDRVSSAKISPNTNKPNKTSRRDARTNDSWHIVPTFYRR